MNSNNNDQKTLCNMLECDIDCTQDFYAYNIPIVKFDYNHFNLKCFISVLNIALIFLFNSCMTREQDDRNQPTDPISDSGLSADKKYTRLPLNISLRDSPFRL